VCFSVLFLLSLVSISQLKQFRLRNIVSGGALNSTPTNSKNHRHATNVYRQGTDCVYDKVYIPHAASQELAECTNNYAYGEKNRKDRRVYAMPTSKD